MSVDDRLSSAVKVRHYSPKTLQAYKGWTQKFQTFTQSKEPQLVSMDDVKGFLSMPARPSSTYFNSAVAGSRV